MSDTQNPLAGLPPMFRQLAMLIAKEHNNEILRVQREMDALNRPAKKARKQK